MIKYFFDLSFIWESLIDGKHSGMLAVLVLRMNIREIKMSWGLIEFDYIKGDIAVRCYRLSDERGDQINPFQPSVAFHIETSHLICTASKMTGFYIKCNTGLKWVKLGKKLLVVHIIHKTFLWNIEARSAKRFPKILKVRKSGRKVKKDLFILSAKIADLTILEDFSKSY